MKNRIKELRESKGLRQGDLAKILGIRQNTLSTWETGKYEPDSASIKQIADYFNVSVDYVIGRVPWTRMPGDQIDMPKMMLLINTASEMTIEQFDNLLSVASQIRDGNTELFKKSKTVPISREEEKLLVDYRALSATGREYVLHSVALAELAHSEKNGVVSNVETAE